MREDTPTKPKSEMNNVCKTVKRSGVNEAQSVLYECMKLRHDTKNSFTRKDLFEIYNNFVVPDKRQFDRNRLSDEQIYNNASSWLNRSIASLVRNGWLGLTFNKDIKRIDHHNLIEDVELCLT